jgi:hypothetical protein
LRRITAGCGADIVIDGVGGEVLSEARGALWMEALQHWGIRRHGSDLEAGQRQELRTVRSTAGGLG